MSPRLRVPASLLALAGALLTSRGCEWPRAGREAAPAPASRPATSAALRADPLPVQQARAYPELASGVFLSLADFEDVPGLEFGPQQARRFRITPGGGAGALRHVVHVTRTGAGALEADLPPLSALVFADLPVHDFRPYTLLSLALRSETLRDDLQVVLESPQGRWACPGGLLRPGWNNVLVDIQRLGEEAGFDASSVQAIHLLLTEARGPLRLYLDDVLLVENTRPLRPTPEGMRLSKVGLVCRLECPGHPPMSLERSPDGLWRLGGRQPLLQLAAPGKALPAQGEDLRLLGARRVSEAEILEYNSVRVRLASTWYFPPRGGEWASLAVRRVRWEHTFYGDGRWVVLVEVNNVGGDAIGAMKFLLPEEGAWVPFSREPKASADANRRAAAGKERVVRDFAGTIGRWTFLLVPPGPDREAMVAAYVDPPALRIAVQAPGAPAEGDADGDGFAEEQGCYVLRAKAGHCRFTVPARTPPLADPVFRVKGSWRGPVHVSRDGQAVRNVARLADGSILFLVPGRLERDASVEVSGEVPPLGD